MREKILGVAVEMFLTYGFKSVTMDDIASQIGMSKKTIYQYFDTKTKLVEATTLHMFDVISTGIECIIATDRDPIEEIYQIKHLVMQHLKNEKSSPQYQLQKYYPKIFASLKGKQFEMMQDCVQSNLRRGKESGVYRENLNVEFISRIYFSSILSIKDVDLFPHKLFSTNLLMDELLEYHVRGICTEKGLKTLNRLLNNHQVQE